MCTPLPWHRGRVSRRTWMRSCSCCAHLNIRSGSSRHVREPGFHAYFPCFDRVFTAHAEWRGGSLAHVLKWLLPLQECLQQASNPSKFDGPLNLPRAENNRRGTSDPLRTKAITDAILDSVTWAYGRALEHLQKALARFLGWCEGCPCHCQCTWGRADEMPRQRMQRRRRAFWRFLGQDRDHVLWGTCPVMGKRAPELACGVTQEALGRLFLQGEAYAIFSSSPASSEDRAASLRDWHAGAAHVMAGLALKLACWSTLPWKLAGLAHHDLVNARAAAKTCLDLYSRAPRAAMHHLMSVGFLDADSPFRPSVESMVVGRPGLRPHWTFICGCST